MSRLRVLAPAKLNLFLHVVGRRPDGYHLLQTVFQLIDLQDEVSLTVTDDGRIVRDPPPDDPMLAAMPDAADLCVKAALRLQAHTGCRLGARIHVTKRIPAGGGLGGGSSDAAAVLLGLNQLWDLGLSRDELATLGLALGADVPVFVHGHNAWAEGLGEQLVPLQTPQRWFVVLRPPVSISTAEVFAASELTRDTPPITIAAFLAGHGHNDCEPVVRSRYPVVAAALDWLGQFAPARLTGTGSCVFAAFADESAARAVAAAPPPGCQAWAVRGIG